MTETFVIVGASLAGAKAAEELRSQGFAGRVVLIGSERDRPYERPPLTKEYLRGEAVREKVYVHEPGFYEENGIELLSGTTVVKIDPEAMRVTLDDGTELGYRRLLLTTGAEPRRLELPGAELAGVHYLRTVEDCDALKERLASGGRVAVIGAGWIGSEFAASARQRGLEVALIDPLLLPNERIFGSEVGLFYRDLHERHGVELRLGSGVEAFEGAGAVERVRTTDGKVVDCDFAVVGVGVVPRVELAAAAGLQVDNGVLVSTWLESSVPGVFAAGDLANAWHPFFEQRIRVEHWANALNQGPAAARAMLGEQVSYDRLPYFFSDQYDVGMEYSGYARPNDDVVLRGDPEDGEFVAFWVRDGVVLAGMNVNVWDVNEHVQSLIRSRQPVERALLADADTPLEEVAATLTASSSRR
jgi:3-phenylpropionate/trans-cinnamate dioxygenase ferredoxin reductase component